MGYLGDLGGYLKELLENATYGLSAIKTLVDDLETRLTAARAANLDKLLENIPYTEQAIESPYGLSPPSSSTSANTFGAWVAQYAANVLTSDFLVLGVVVRPNHTTECYAEIELGKGGAGSEVTIASVCFEPIGAKENITFNFPIPIKVDANTRIAARAKDSVASALAYYVHVLVQYLPL